MVTIAAPGACPCGSTKYIRLRCLECPSDKIDQAMNSPQGELLREAIRLDTMLQLPGMALTPGDITTEEWEALEILWSERELARSRKK